MSEPPTQSGPESPAGGQPEAGNPAASERRAPWWHDRAPLILVPLDGSEGAKLALAAARRVAPLANASIQILYVADEPVASADELLKRVGLQPSETTGLVVEQATGEPGQAIADTAQRHQASLIAMTIRGLSNSDQWQVSPVVESVLNRAPCPLLLLRAELAPWLAQRQRAQRVLLPLDGTPSAAAAIGPALELADHIHADVDILNVAVQAEPPSERGSLTAPQYIDQPHYEWPAWAQEFASRFGTALGQYRPSAKTRVFVRSGNAPEEILRFAREEQSDLIVLEWKGRFSPEPGKVIKQVLADMPCPVLLLPERDESLGW